jgi:hypothetical protein
VVRVHAPYQNLVLDFDPQSLYNETSRQRKAYIMRPVDQVMADLKKAEEVAAQANASVTKYKTELQVIYAEVKKALGMMDFQLR